MQLCRVGTTSASVREYEMGRAYNKGGKCLAEVDTHTGSASSSKVSRRAEEILPAVEETERHKDSGGSDSEEAAQGDILYANKKRKLPV